jgi:hypothetical protein
MDIQSIPLISVSYNSPELVNDLLRSFRLYYRNPVTIIDGSSEDLAREIEVVCAKFQDVRFIHFQYNIHHGPGMAWAYQNLELNGPVLVLDSDVYVLRSGLIEALMSELTPEMYGVGYVNYVNEGGFDVTYVEGAVRYLHPACMLCNIEVVRQWPMPTKHGAPNIEPMLAIHRTGNYDLIKGISWVSDDFSTDFEHKHYLRHDWQGTVKRTGGYHLEEWLESIHKKSRNSIKEYEAYDSTFDSDLLQLISSDARVVLDMNCKDGALAQAYKTVNPNCKYIGLESDASKIDAADRYCDEVLIVDLMNLNESFYAGYSHCDTWILSDILVKFTNPWDVLASIRRNISVNGCVIISIPNSQHWSVLAKLGVGDFRYEKDGLVDRSHLRFFTRATMLEMISGAGFKVARGFPVIRGELKNEYLIAAIRSMAIAVGADPELALQDSMPARYIVKLVVDETQSPVG